MSKERSDLLRHGDPNLRSECAAKDHPTDVIVTPKQMAYPGRHDGIPNSASLRLFNLSDTGLRPTFQLLQWYHVTSLHCQLPVNVRT